MILLIDNYDSFSYNLYQMVGSIEPAIKVVRNDELTVQEIQQLSPDAIIISPGPGRPEDAGICQQLVSQLGASLPILGVCLGHQAICQAYGAKVEYARTLMHGKQSIAQVEPDASGKMLFEHLPDQIPVARYHSLAVNESTLPKHLVVTSRADDGEVMSVQHATHPVFGVQFHPESILTPDGATMLANFIGYATRRNR